jgi:type I restriction enzyme S subunit
MSHLPPGWAHTNIGAVCLGVAKRGPRDHPAEEFNYIDIGGIDSQRIVETKRLRGEKAPSRARQIVKAGDVVLSTVRTYLKKTAVVPTELDGAIASTGFCILRPGPAIDSRFLFYRVIESSFVAKLSSQQTGSSYPAVRDRDVFDQPIELPPLNEQKRIAAAIEEQFSRLDDSDASLQSAELRSEAMRRSVLNLALAPIDRIRQLGDLAETQLGKMLSAKSKTGVGARPYLRNKNVQWGHIDLDDVLEMDFSDREIEKFSLQLGDVLVCEGGEVGRTAIWRGGIEGCCYQKALHRIRVGDQLLPEYLIHVMRWLAYRNAFDPYVTGSTIKHLPQEDLRLISIPAPTIAEQLRIVADVEERLSALTGVLDAVQRANRRSAALRRLILERAFCGELVPQDRADEPAAALLERISANRMPVAPKRQRTVKA